MPDTPDVDVPFSTPKEAMEFLAKEAERLLRHVKPSQKAEYRQALKLIVDLVGRWSQLYKLDREVVTVEEMAEELKKLKARILGGPQGLVNDAEG